MDDTRVFEPAGYGLRVAALFVIGGIWACLHRMETDPLEQLIRWFPGQR